MYFTHILFIGKNIENYIQKRKRKENSTQLVHRVQIQIINDFAHNAWHESESLYDEFIVPLP